MQPKSIRPVVFSPTGTSRKSAEAVARGIARTGGTPSAIPEIRTIDLTHTAAAETLPADAVALFAVPVYGGHVPSLALKRMEGLRGSGTPAVLLVVYGNRAFEHAAAELAAFVSDRGFVPVAAGAFVGEHSYSTPQRPIAAGRPDEKDIAEAEAFGEATGRKLASQGIAAIDVARLKDVRTPLIPLLRFIRFVLAYRRRQKKHPVVLLPACDAQACVHCGRCAAQCPTGAIARGEEERTDPARCIRCCACVKGCPVGARHFETPFSEALSRNFARRKPPVTLL